MILHLIKHSPFDSNAMEQCINLLGADDGVLLLENGVYGLIWQTNRMQKLSQSHQLYVLKTDATTRGISTIPEYFTTINYDGFVDLTLQFNSSISW
jgi:tRNA 2-thiouridine synthesizing protein B